MTISEDITLPSFRAQYLDVSLSEAVRPTSLESYFGQDHLLNCRNGLIRNYIRLGYLPSMLLVGPPGYGKTTLARILPIACGYSPDSIYEISATTLTTEFFRQLVSLKKDQQQSIVFIDEIHRLTKQQQEWLLPYMEDGRIVLIGATTITRPQRRIRKAILSRCQVFTLNKLTFNEFNAMLCWAIGFENLKRKYFYRCGKISFDSKCLEMIIDHANGDSRTAINFIELVSQSFKSQEEPSFNLSWNDISSFWENTSSSMSVDINTRKKLYEQLWERMKLYFSLRQERSKSTLDQISYNGNIEEYDLQMQVSDNSDIDSGYSSNDDDNNNNSNNNNDDDDALVASIYYALLILETGVSPRQLFKQILLFAFESKELSLLPLRALLSLCKKYQFETGDNINKGLSDIIEIIGSAQIEYGGEIADHFHLLYNYHEEVKKMEEKMEKQQQQQQQQQLTENDVVVVSFSENDISAVETEPKFEVDTTTLHITSPEIIFDIPQQLS
ncbi:hypothetical protein KGF56_000941 [Candida oxycetoniae]|uniref:AAA+ ATPase domain-containing protein n=1 Tax=Candida oxycetoniae TaxID=497107 RepID=A0AAI9WZP1_9ASCO|nr:uncharacterized protein KGF56_000941 [Candida oxycetoniae]KAI3406100.2 hypothetical protein KGF56_000941 [Candida oxycetoniae]